MLPLKFSEKNFSFEGARPEKGLKIDFFNMSKPYFFVENFPNIPLEMNTTRQKSIFYIQILFQAGLLKDFLIKGKKNQLFLYWLSQKCFKRMFTKLLEKKI